MPDADELIRLSAREAVHRLRRREVTPLELLEAAIRRIEAVDPAINALPIRCFERARAHARRIDPDPRGGEGRHPGWLAGLPIAIKDLMDVEGVRTTYGCPLYRDNVAAASDVLVKRLEGLGGVVAAKSNTPEFGMLPVTDNRVFGPTRNPWRTDLTPGGSSGGAAAAVVAGEVWLAHGSDIGGSLRIPAALSGCVGLRPSPGRVPRSHSGRAFNPLAVQGPMARSVDDLALFLDAMAGFDLGDPLSLPEPEISFSTVVASARPPKRIGFALDLGLGGTDPEVARIVTAAVRRFEAMGTAVEEASPDFAGVPRVYTTLLGLAQLPDRERFVLEHRDEVEPMLALCVDAARRLSLDDVVEAERGRARIFAGVAAFFREYDLFVLPTVSVPAFDVTRRGVEDVDGWVYDVPGWFQQCWGTVVTSCPALSMPAGFTAAGLPVGIQLMGPVRGEARVLAAAALLEQALGLGTDRPIDPRAP